ncbi:hypothetical protein PpBr36_06882 [Pyricularia pennisetigena]|uniref:hypothetical protein n=1 Tax=Pyricularia pennisetigena TaxID=1578925 RepID=UPI001151B2BA|nr:hypothetical protein PpBr36_06882 [Pyricularia pennisetigena]TLS25897.1 hypothetical protein PpBr36_06882 [Pyricularia pennisetigena]
MHLSPAFLSLVLLWSSSSVVALAVVERSSEARLDDPNGMAWTGKVFPNGPDVTMFGDAEHILALNPGYAPEDSWHALQNVTSEASKIQKRVPTGANPNGFFCGVYSTGDRGDLNAVPAELPRANAAA